MPALAARPAGLTALAVLNFLFAAYTVATTVVIVSALRIKLDPALMPTEIDANVRPQLVLVIALPLWFLVTTLAASAAKVGLWIASGVGYLGQKRFLGRTLGNAYAILSLAESALALVVLDFGVQPGTIIGVAYPIVTLALLNGFYRDDLVR